MKLVLATGNPHKVEEFSRILAPMGIHVIPQSEAAPGLEVEENGTTFAENSFIKAKAVYDVCHLPTMADDSGLSVDALNGAPGVYTARYAGEENDRDKNMDLLLRNLEGVPKENRTAHFTCAITVIMDDDTVMAVEGKCPGWIAFQRTGEDGFGYDPLFMYGDVSFAQMTHEEKDAVSHRGAAVRAITEKLKNYLEGVHGGC